jgi:hypothetical protein
VPRDAVAPALGSSPVRWSRDERFVAVFDEQRLGWVVDRRDGTVIGTFAELPPEFRLAGLDGRVQLAISSDGARVWATDSLSG